MTHIDAELSALLEPATGGAIVAAVGPLWLAFQTANSEPITAAARARLWTMALNGLPAWALQQTVEQYIRGSVANQSTDFAPTPAAVASSARGLLRDLRTQQWLVWCLRRARVEAPPPADYEARKARVAELMKLRSASNGTQAEADKA